VASSNRCTDTPFIIYHKLGVDTVYRDQTKNGSSWVSVGTYNFRGDSGDSILITNQATKGTYIVADAIRLVTFDTTTTFISISDNRQVMNQFVLYQNYPNPFNPVTKISWQSAIGSYVDLSVYNLRGQKVATLVSGWREVGYHRITWDASEFANGMYFYKISTGNGFSSVRKLILIK
jgi:hypothetical protein